MGGLNPYTKPSLAPRPAAPPLDKDRTSTGHLACPGCGASLASRIAMKVLGPRTVFVVPACCFAVIDGPFPTSAAGVPLLHCAFETAAVTASGVRAGLAARGIDDVTVLAWAGDGGTFDIGLQALSAAAERQEDVLYVCYDNEAYMNTGIQRSSATPRATWTTTTPAGAVKREPKKDLDAIIIAHRIPYFATASMSFLDDFTSKFRKAKATRGFRFIRILSPCSPGWKCEEGDTVLLGRLAVHSKLFPLYECEDGERYTINVRPDGAPIDAYLKRQGRFSHLKPADIAGLQAEVDHNWERLVARAGGALPAARPTLSPPGPDGPTSVPTRDEFAEIVKNLSLSVDAGALDEMYEMLVHALENPQAGARSLDEAVGQVTTMFQLRQSLL